MPLTADEKDSLRESARSLLDRLSDSAAVRSRLADAGHAPDLWRRMVDLGWAGMHIPVAFGGAGAGFEAVGVVVHELGRHLTQAPFLASAVVATGALTFSANRELAGEIVPGLASGEAIAVAALADRNGSYARPGPTLDSAPGGFVLRGSSGFVLDADVADHIVVAASHGNLPVVAVVEAADPRVRIERTPTVDATRRLFQVVFDGVVVPESRLVALPGDEAGRLIERTVSLGAVGALGDAVGVADAVTERTAEYARSRQQFGRAIGSFQAVKHHCADMLIALEASRAAVDAAFASLDEPGDGASLAADVASSFAGPACSRVCALAIQVHGGIGFTWEHDSHLFLKRAKLDEVLFGTPRWHRQRLARTVFPSISPAWSTALQAS